MSWSFLTRLLEEISLHSTYLGKIWLTTFLILRIMLTIVAGESIYYDEQSSFVCNSQQPGCTNVCYDSFAPLSYVRFWIFQIITVATPTVLYLAFAIHRIKRSEGSPGDKKRRRTEQAVNVQADQGGEFAEGAGQVKKNDYRWHDGRRAIRADGLMWAYTLQLVLRTVAEVGFLLGQYVMYGLEVIPRFECINHPCLHRVDCFVSRPTEKTIFLYVMYAVGGLSLALNLAELWHLGMGALRDLLPGSRAKRQQRIANGDPLPPHPPPPPPRYVAKTEEADPRRVAITAAAASQLQGYLRAIQRRLELTVSPPPRRAGAAWGYGESGAGRGGRGGEGGRRETPASRSAVVGVSINPQVRLGKKSAAAAAAADEVGDSGEEQGEVKATSRKGRAVRSKKYLTISV